MARKNLLNLIANATTEDVTKGFVTDLNYAIEKYEKTDKRPPSNTLKPSSIRCVRSGVFQVLGVPMNEEPPNSNLIGICESGTFVHEMIQGKVLRMKDIGLNWEYINVADYVRSHNLNLEVRKECDFEAGEFETKLYDPVRNISFLCDGILKHGRKYYIFEIKSISNGKFYSTKEVPAKYKDQAIAYSELLGIKDVLFLFVDRDLYSKKSFLYTPTDEERQSWRDRVEYALECIRDSKIPTKPNFADRSFCAYCAYTDICNKVGDKESEYNRETIRESI